MLNTIKTELKKLAPVALPAVLAQLAQMAMGVIDTLMAGHYSNEALAAIAIGTSLLHPVMIFFMGLFLALNPIIAHLKGAGALLQIGSRFRLALIIAVAMSPIAIVILLNAQYILTLLEVDTAISSLATGYLHATVWGMPGLLLFLALRFCNEGLFSTPAIMTATVASIPLNVLLNYWFMYGGYGIPQMGAVGVGYATSLIWTFMFFGLLLYTALTPRYKALKIFKLAHLPSRQEIAEVFRLGLPMAITLGFEVTMFAAVSLMIARYPTEIMGAHQVAVNIASITFMIPLGISQAITARVGYCAGLQDPAAIQIAGYTGIGISALLSFLSAAAMILIPGLWAALYTQDTAIIQLAVSLLFYAAIFQFSDSIQVASAGALRGIKDTNIPMIITAISYWLVGFPIGYYMAEYQNFQAQGYWMGLIAGLTTAGILLLNRWRKLTQFNASIPSKVINQH